MKRAAVVLLAIVLASCSVAQAQSPATPTPSPTAQPTARVHATPMQASASEHASSCTVTGTQGDSLNVRRGPGMHAEITAGLLPGQTVTVLALAGDWYEIDNPPGFISREYCE